MAAQTAVTHRR